MKRFLSSAAVLALTAGAAFAADLPSRKAEPLLPPPPPPMWAGFYAGLNAGGTWSTSNSQSIGVGPVAYGAKSLYNPVFNQGTASPYTLSAAASANFVNQSDGGFVGGGQIGYNSQFFNSLVVGLEADIQGVAGSAGNRTGVAAYPIEPAIPGGGIWTNYTSARGSLQYLGTARGRLGWLFTPTMLVYGTGGLAYGGVSLSAATAVYNVGGGTFGPVIGGVNYSNTQVGWTAGGGLEWMFMPNWSAKVEYLYYDLGTVRQNFAMAAQSTYDSPLPPSTMTDFAIFGGQVRARVSGSILRAGLNHHFNWGAAAPVVAKY